MRSRAAILIWLLLAATPAGAADILVNGAFDAQPLGTGWTQVPYNVSYPLIVQEPAFTPQSAPAYDWQGGFADGVDFLSQDVNVPAGATQLTLKGYFRITTGELGGIIYDVLDAELLTTANVLLERFHRWTNLDANGGWTAFSYQAAGNYAGTTVRLRFHSTNDSSNETNFLLDTISLDAINPVGVEPTLPAVSGIQALSPNPTRSGSRWRLDLTSAGRARVSIHDLQGRLVRRLADGYFPAGRQHLVWDGTDAGDAPVASGVYVCRAEVGSRVFVKRISLIR